MSRINCGIELQRKISKRTEPKISQSSDNHIEAFCGLPSSSYTLSHPGPPHSSAEERVAGPTLASLIFDN
jgi:hypothetical protein